MSARSKKSKQTEPDITPPKKLERSRISSMLTGTAVTRVSNSGRSPSPLNISRTDEKEELAHLNDRLASYIDYVRKLERDKDTLTQRITTISEERFSEVDLVRKTYENEINSLRQLVDDLAKEKAANEIESKKNREDAADARTKLTKRDHDVRGLQRRIDVLEREMASYKQGHEQYQLLRPEYESLEKKLESMRKDLESETIMRTGLENKVTSLREELDFKNRLFEEERSKLVQRTITVEEEIDNQKTAEWESRLFVELNEYREQTASELQEYRTQLETSFKTKLDQLRFANVEATKDSDKLREDLMILRKQSEEFCHELAKKSGEVDLLQRRVVDLEKLLDKERQDYEAQLANDQKEIKRLHEEIEQRFAEFTELMNTKIVLDQEILMYRKMLEGEESRLNLASPRASSFGSNVGAKKRRLDAGDDLTSDNFEMSLAASRFAFRASTFSVGDVEFTADQDGSGKWIKLINVAKNDVNIGNWVLKHQADGHEVTFKFNKTVVLQPGATCTVWGSDSTTANNPPTDIVMKRQNFHGGANINITLLNDEEKEQASCLVVRECLRPILPTRRIRSGVAKSDEKCLMM